MAIPAPGADETATPLYGIRRPNDSRRAYKFYESVSRIADDVEAALVAFGLPTVVSGTPVVALSDAARDAHWGAPITAANRRALQDAGAQTVRPDKGYTEQYFAGLTDGGTNTAGAIVAGWYPLSGATPMGSLKRNTAAAWNFPNNAVTGLSSLINDVNNQGVTLGSGAVTIVTPGLYEVGCGLIFAANATGARLLFINKNSTTYSVNPLSAASLPGGAAANTGIQTKAIAPLAFGDVLRFWGFQNSGGALAIQGDGASIGDAGGNFAYARYLGPARS